MHHTSSPPPPTTTTTTTKKKQKTTSTELFGPADLLGRVRAAYEENEKFVQG
jgi:hypothetical protein